MMMMKLLMKIMADNDHHGSCLMMMMMMMMMLMMMIMEDNAHHGSRPLYGEFSKRQTTALPVRRPNDLLFVLFKMISYLPYLLSTWLLFSLYIEYEMMWQPLYKTEAAPGVSTRGATRPNSGDTPGWREDDCQKKEREKSQMVVFWVDHLPIEEGGSVSDEVGIL